MPKAITQYRLTNARKKIASITRSYKKFFVEDYKASVTYISEVRESLKNEWGEFDAPMKYIERRVGEIPEVLYDMLTKGLNDEEMAAWKDDPKHRIESWFFTRNPEFRVTKNMRGYANYKKKQNVTTKS